ncbi:MAG: putative ester cyclase [Ulvibacter sp.]|jgi:predicted ester cyclase
MKQGITLLTLVYTLIFFSQCASVKTQKLIKKNEETVRVWFEEGWNKHKNDELVERCFDPEWQDGNPLRANQVAGHEGIRELIKSYEKGATETHFIITHLFANESQVAIRYEVAATHSGALFGIEATGRRFTSTGIVLYDMKDGRIKTSWQELDLSGIVLQLK